MTILAELLTSKTRDEVLTDMLSALQSVGFPTSGWYSTSVPYRLLYAVASVYSSFSSTLVSVTSGGLLTLSTGKWLTLLASNVFGLDRYAATFAVGTLTVEDVAGGGPYTIAANQLWFTDATGLRYNNTAGFTIPLSGSVAFSVQAESSGSAYNVATDAITEMSTPLPGVSYLTGQSAYNYTSPWLTTQGTDEETDADLISRCQDQWSTLGYGQNADWYRYYARNGHDSAVSVTKARVDTMVGHSTVIDYPIGASCPSVSVSGVPVNQYPFVVEVLTTGALGAGTFRWSSDGGTTWDGTGITLPGGGTYVLGTTGVTVTFAAGTYTDGDEYHWGSGYGGVTVTCAGTAGALSSTVIQDVQANFDAKVGVGIWVYARSAKDLPIDPAGVIYAYSAYAATAKAEAEAALDELLALMDTGQTVYLSQIIDALQYSATEVRNVTLTNPAADITPLAHEVVTKGSLAGLTVVSV